jgi:hypothetical protein
VPLYNAHGPTLAGFPFFFWYQFGAALSVVLNAAGRPAEYAGQLCRPDRRGRRLAGGRYRPVIPSDRSGHALIAWSFRWSGVIA